MINGVTDENLISVLIKTDFVQSKGWKKSHSTQKFIHLHQKFIKLRNNVYPCKPPFYYIKVEFDYTGLLTGCFMHVLVTCKFDYLQV